MIHLSASNAAVKNEGSYTLTSTYAFISSTGTLHLRIYE